MPKLPNLGPSIFTRMTEAAHQVGAINLGQGFPGFPPDQYLLDALAQAAQHGPHQYAPSTGLPALRQEISKLFQRSLGAAYDPGTEITVTSGATEALASVILTEAGAGDEVIILDPAYDSYGPVVRMAGAVPIHMPMTAAFRPDWERIADAISPRTKLLIVCTPHNPSGTAWEAHDVAALRELADRHPFRILSDEVYAHIRFDGIAHHAPSTAPDLRSRSYIVGSFGKLLHVTGWKTGFILAPAELTAQARAAHQFLTFSTHTPTQAAVAAYLAVHPDFEQALATDYQHRRDRFATALAQTAFEPLPVQGSYFLCARYSRISSLPDEQFCHWLIAHAGVAAIPLSAFYADGHDPQVVRFCFAKPDAVLDDAATRLARLPIMA